MNDAKYGYDDTSQLTSAVYDKLPAEAYDYDANGNRKAYETGKNNQLLSDGVFDYTYDDEGNRISKISKNSKTEYIWDHRNRLVRVLDNGKSVEYDYDYQNRLVCRNDEIFVHDGWQVACSLKNGRIEHCYLWGAVQDELLAMDGHWTLRDHLNTVGDVIDMKGKVVSHLEYDAFGKLVSSTGDKSLFRYTGKMFDEATNLQWNINRWYDANVGRWISEDPIGFEAKDANLVRYVGNSMPLYRDKFGLSPQKIVCSKRSKNSVPAPTHTPNGCGSDSTQWVPDDPIGFAFGAACNAHDICYGTCGKTQSECDQAFRDNMYDVCEAYKNIWLYDKYLLCRQTAYIYYTAVCWMGKNSYEGGQTDNCEWIIVDCCQALKNPNGPITGSNIKPGYKLELE